MGKTIIRENSGKPIPVDSEPTATVVETDVSGLTAALRQAEVGPPCG